MIIVFTNGCFDVLHRGHIEYLKESKKLGDYLIVGINSDASVKRLKGNDRPLYNQWDRKLFLEELRCVDEVIIFDEDNPIELIKKIKPDILTKGGDNEIDKVPGHDLVKTIILPFVDGYGTSKLLRRLEDKDL
jgi:rfaE bifunctional protein nucleotidyltransferase chain/domain